MNEVREIRAGKGSRDFEGDDGKKADKGKAFVAYYGNEFKLKSLSIESNINHYSRHHASLVYYFLSFLSYFQGRSGHVD